MTNPWLSFFKQLLLGKETKSPLMFNMRYGLIVAGLFSVFLLATVTPEKIKVFYWMMVFILAHILLVNIFAFCKPQDLTYSAQIHSQFQKKAPLGSERTKVEPEDAEGKPAVPTKVEPARDYEENV